MLLEGLIGEIPIQLLSFLLVTHQISGMRSVLVAHIASLASMILNAQREVDAIRNFCILGKIPFPCSPIRKFLPERLYLFKWLARDNGFHIIVQYYFITVFGFFKYFFQFFSRVLWRIDTKYAVAAIKSGDDIKTVQDNLGHATAAFTLDV